MPPETWQGAEASRSAVKRWQRRRQRRRRARNLSPRVPNFPVMRRNPRRKFANFQRARRGRRVTCGRARAHARAGGWLPPGRRACCCRLSRTHGRPPQPVGASARAGAATLAAHWLSLRASGEAPLASTPPASSRPRPLLAGIATSSPPLPRVTARARAAEGGGGAREAAGDASSAAESPRSRLNFSRSS